MGCKDPEGHLRCLTLSRLLNAFSCCPITGQPHGFSLPTIFYHRSASWLLSAHYILSQVSLMASLCLLYPITGQPHGFSLHTISYHGSASWLLSAHYILSQVSLMASLCSLYPITGQPHDFSLLSLFQYMPASVNT